MALIRALLVAITVATVMLIRPAVDRSEDGAVWVGEADTPSIGSAVAIARKVGERRVRVPCGVFMLDLPPDFWSLNIVVRGNGACSRAIMVGDDIAI